MRRQILLLATAASLWGAGCVTQRTSWPIDPGDPVALGPDQGLLVVHVSTSQRIRSIDIGGVQAAEDLPEGTQLRLIGITAGSYRWSEFEVQDVRSARYDSFLVRNVYVGMIEVERSSSLSVWMDSLDRTAMALEQLRKRYPDLLAKYPVVYSGPARHVFLQRYREATAKRAVEGAR
jgi:hypothetical protein